MRLLQSTRSIQSVLSQPLGVMIAMVQPNDTYVKLSETELQQLTSLYDVAKGQRCADLQRTYIKRFLSRVQEPLPLNELLRMCDNLGCLYESTQSSARQVINQIRRSVGVAAKPLTPFWKDEGTTDWLNAFHQECLESCTQDKLATSDAKSLPTLPTPAETDLAKAPAKPFLLTTNMMARVVDAPTRDLMKSFANFYLKGMSHILVFDSEEDRKSKSKRPFEYWNPELYSSGYLQCGDDFVLQLLPVKTTFGRIETRDLIFIQLDDQGQEEKRETISLTYLPLKYDSKEAFDSTCEFFVDLVKNDLPNYPTVGVLVQAFEQAQEGVGPLLCVLRCLYSKYLLDENAIHRIARTLLVGGHILMKEASQYEFLRKIKAKVNLEIDPLWRPAYRNVETEKPDLQANWRTENFGPKANWRAQFDRRYSRKGQSSGTSVSNWRV